MKALNIDINLIDNNNGQLKGINTNPRDLNTDGFEKLVKSIQDFPEMLIARPLIVVEHDERFVCIAGNQRLRALKYLNIKECKCIDVSDLSIDKINELIIKDNVSYGEWNYDLLANDWDVELLVEWGLELPVIDEDIELDVTKESNNKESDKASNGDTWVLGNHKLICGAIEDKDVEIIINAWEKHTGKKAELIERG